MGGGLSYFGRTFAGTFFMTSALALELQPKTVYPNGSLYLVSVYIPLQALAQTR